MAELRAIRLLLAVAVLHAAVALVTPIRAGAAEPTMSPEQAITGFGTKQNSKAGFVALNRAAAAEPATLRKAALSHLSEQDPQIRYAALYALALTIESSNGADQLAGFLTSPIADERLLAAAALAGLRDKRALPVLIAALDQREPLRYREPGTLACDFARLELLNFTDRDFGLKVAKIPEEIAATKPEWEGWWQTAKASLHIDPQTRRLVE